MQHPLDNPAWNALNTGNKDISVGNGPVSYFPAEISPFVGLQETSTKNFDILHKIFPEERIAVFISLQPAEIPKQWKVLQFMPVLQMVYEGNAPEPASGAQHQLLTNEHIPAMLALTQLTNPGPFFQRTIDFGHYHGIFNGEHLIAMAGQRMNPFPYAEISAVCVHPEHLGKGHAKQLLNHQVRRIIHAGQIPFLHALSSNAGAINLYENIGFVKRHELSFYAIKKA